MIYHSKEISPEKKKSPFRTAMEYNTDWQPGQSLASEITMVMKDNQDLDPNRDIKLLICEILIIFTLNKFFNKKKSIEVY